jgi:predicted  nucleic acid-binding Zn-ribbon protein
MIKEECTKCNKIYSTTYAELVKKFVSHCPTCEAAIWNSFNQAIKDGYAMLQKAGNN